MRQAQSLPNRGDRPRMTAPSRAAAASAGAVQQAPGGAPCACGGGCPRCAALVSGTGAAVIQRQAAADTPGDRSGDMMRIYSFGPTGAGRMQMDAGVTVFPPAAPVDAEGSELVQAGTEAQPIRSRLGRYFTLDDPHRPYPAPVPPCTVRAFRAWRPDDGSGLVREEQSDGATRYYGSGQPLGTQLGTEDIFVNDRPGLLSMSYVFSSPEASFPFLLMAHSIRYVAGEGAPPGATVLGSTEAPIAANPEAPA
jgi:hypothetical protein